MIIRRDSVGAFDFGGLSVRDYTAGLDRSSSFAVIDVPPATSHARSWSKRSDKYYYVISGAIEFMDASGAHGLTAGDVCFVPQGEWFAYRNCSGVPSVILLFHTPSFDLDSEVFEEPLED